MFKWKAHRKGFSLIELVVAMAILSILMAPMLKQIIFTADMSSKAKDELIAQQMAQSYMENLKSGEVAKLEIDLKEHEDFYVIISIVPDESKKRGGGFEGLGEETIVVMPSFEGNPVYIKALYDENQYEYTISESLTNLNSDVHQKSDVGFLDIVYGRQYRFYDINIEVGKKEMEKPLIDIKGSVLIR